MSHRVTVDLVKTVGIRYDARVLQWRDSLIASLENVCMVSIWLSIYGIEDKAVSRLLICGLIQDGMMKYQIHIQRVHLRVLIIFIFHLRLHHFLRLLQNLTQIMKKSTMSCHCH